jgi:antigen flippase
MVRTKLVAILLGPSGVGLVGLYLSAIDMVGTIAKLGINESGVREVAEACGSGDAKQIARTIKTLRRLTLSTGILGWILTASLSYPLSIWAFGSGAQAWAIAILGCSLLLTFVTGGQSALLQGMRRIGDIARMGVLGAIMSTVVAVSLYWWLGQNGIVPVIIATAAVNLGFSWWYARKIKVVPVELSWLDTGSHAKRFIKLGVSFMWSAVLGAAVALGIRSLIASELGLDANGIYQAAWTISGMFGGFIIAAMGTDFYPRLTAVSNDHPVATKLVNEQTEIGVLLALPGVQVSLAFAPLLMHLFFSAKFVAGSAMLPWFLVSVFLRMITYPMGYILVAKAAGGKFAMLTTLFHVAHISIIVVLIPLLQLRGVAIANTLLCVIYMFGMRLVAGPLVEFSWATQTIKLMVVSISLVMAGFMATLLLPTVPALVLGVLLLILSCVFSLRGLVTRLGEQHRLILMACRIPFGRTVCGL